MSGTLFVVATPIGNLEDITLRALRVLREVDLIAAEDTRRTAGLLAHHSIQTRTISFHEHNTRSRLPGLVATLESGKSIAIVTDAGMPGVSDPGLELVQACIQRGIRTEPIPGANAPLTALVVSGFPLNPLSIYGFPPIRSKAKLQWFGALAGVPHTIAFLESPHRIQTTLSAAATLFGNRPIMVGRELTKVHQELLRGTAAELAAAVSTPKGEFTIVVGPADKPLENIKIQVADEDLAAEFSLLTNNASSRRAAIATIARKYGQPSKEVYAAIERVKKSTA